jgi:H+/Cl- antiporter ClcA
LKPATFDRVSLVVLGFVLGFSAVVAVTTWDWFPTGEWGDIASIPANALNYAALLLPLLTLLVYVTVRRRWFEKRGEPGDSNAGDGPSGRS